jgi:preprotein translocase subunit SecD
MNRYPLWKNLLIGLVLLWGLIYTLPNFYGEVPAVQVSSGKATLKLDATTAIKRVEESLAAAGIQHDGLFADLTSVRARFRDTDTQLKAKDAIEKAFNPDAADPSYVVALNLLSASPQWLTNIHALPMYLGLDLRGGVHFLLQVDMKGAVTKRLDATTGDLRTLLRDKNVRHAGISREGASVVVKFRDAETQARARSVIGAANNDLQLERARTAPTSSSPPPSRRWPRRPSRSSRSARTSAPCTTGSTNSAWPSR